MSNSISSPMEFKNYKVFRYTLAGRPLVVETGKMAADILLNGKAPSDIEIMTLTPAVSYNEELCAQLGIEVAA